MEGFGEKLTELRKRKGLSQQKLASALNVSQQAVFLWEKDKREPSFDTLKKIATVLDVSLNAFLDGNWSEYTEEPKKDVLGTFYFENKLEQIGYSLGFLEEDAAIWINFPDGYLELTLDDLKKLDEESSSYLKFRLQEFKQNHIKDFRAAKKKRED